MDTLIQDLRYAVRMLLKNPGFALVAILSLALGIGANTTIFTVVHNVLLRPLPFPQPDRLQALWTNLPKWGQESASLPDFTDWRKAKSFDSMMAYVGTSGNLGRVSDPERLIIGRVRGDFFGVLGMSPVLGRGFTEEEDRPNAPKVAILSYGLWQRRFGRDPKIVGQTIEISAVPVTVVGIAPPELAVVRAADVWQPLALEVNPNARRGDFLRVIGRLKPGVSTEQAQAEMTSLARSLDQQYPESNKGVGIIVTPLHTDMVRNVRPVLLSLWAAVGFVLLIVAANVAGLLLARGAVRQKELAIRAALGAGSPRIVRQLLTESVVLAVIGGALGIGVGVWGFELLMKLVPASVLPLPSGGVETPVLFFAVAITLGTGILFGILPSLSAARTNLNDALKEGGRTSATGGRHAMRRALVVGEIAVSLLLLAGSGLMIRTIYRLQHVDPGFRAEGVLSFRLALPGALYNDTQVTAFTQQIQARLQALPQVKSVGAATDLYLSGGGNYLTFVVQGLHDPGDPNSIDANVRAVTPGFFPSLGVRLVRGRTFDDRDNAQAPRVAVINERLVRRYFPNQDLLGKRIALDTTDGKPEWAEIVGIVGDVRQESLDKESYPEMIVPLAQRPQRGFTMLIHTTGDPKTLIEAARREVKALDSSLAVYGIQTMSEMVSTSIADRNLQTYLLGGFAALALLLAVVGIYGVVAQTVAQRTAEFGIRMALGATPTQVVTLVLRYGLVMTAVGLAFGLAGTLVLTRFMSTLLYGVSARDPWTLAGVALLLAVAALLACYIPARRAMRVDPMVALRYE